MTAWNDERGWPDRLSAALRALNSPLAGARPEALADTGLAHLHLRLPGSGLLARIPKQSQMQLPGDANLAYQAACFGRMSFSGHTPRLARTLPVSIDLPRGALLVEEVVGRPALLPDDLPAIARALAAIHGLPLPMAEERSPLLDPCDPLAALLTEISAQATYLSGRGVPPPSRTRIESVLRHLSHTHSRWKAPPRCLIAFDAHPGNFMVRPNGEAVLVDLEKGRYGYGALDIAHATLYTSTTWDTTHRVVLRVPEIRDTYGCWRATLGDAAAGSPESWVTLRTAMWLWSVTWCAKWLAMADRVPDVAATGEDWSTRLSSRSLVGHVEERVRHFLSPEVVDEVVGGLAELAATLRA